MKHDCHQQRGDRRYSNFTHMFFSLFAAVSCIVLYTVARSPVTVGVYLPKNYEERQQRQQLLRQQRLLAEERFRKHGTLNFENQEVAEELTHRRGSQDRREVRLQNEEEDGGVGVGSGSGAFSAYTVEKCFWRSLFSNSPFGTLPCVQDVVRRRRHSLVAQSVSGSGEGEEREEKNATLGLAGRMVCDIVAARGDCAFAAAGRIEGGRLRGPDVPPRWVPSAGSVGCTAASFVGRGKAGTVATVRALDVAGQPLVDAAEELVHNECDNVDPSSFQSAYLSPAEVLATLRRHATIPIRKGHVKREKRNKKVPKILISGDSMMRHLLLRLAEIFRSMFAGSRHHPAIIEHYFHADAIYFLYEKEEGADVPRSLHDALHVFTESPAAPLRGFSSVEEYFGFHLSHAMEGIGGKAKLLLEVDFLWDPYMTEPRLFGTSGAKDLDNGEEAPVVDVLGASYGLVFVNYAYWWLNVESAAYLEPMEVLPLLAQLRAALRQSKAEVFRHLIFVGTPLLPRTHPSVKMNKKLARREKLIEEWCEEATKEEEEEMGAHRFACSYLDQGGIISAFEKRLSTVDIGQRADKEWLVSRPFRTRPPKSGGILPASLQPHRRHRSFGTAVAHVDVIWRYRCDDTHFMCTYLPMLSDGLRTVKVDDRFPLDDACYLTRCRDDVNLATWQWMLKYLLVKERVV